MAAEQAPLPTCGVKPHRKFRQINPNITNCCNPPGHKGRHVYCVKVRQGVDYRSHALHYMGEINRNTLEPLMYVDMDGQQLETDEECCALWQFFEWVKKDKKRKRKQS